MVKLSGGCLQQPQPTTCVPTTPAIPGMLQALGPVFAMWYLRLLNLAALGSALGAGCLAAALAAWATRQNRDKAPVRLITIPPCSVGLS
jgi:hypothetical protein